MSLNSLVENRNNILKDENKGIEFTDKLHDIYGLVGIKFNMQDTSEET